MGNPKGARSFYTQFSQAVLFRYVNNNRTLNSPPLPPPPPPPTHPSPPSPPSLPSSLLPSFLLLSPRIDPEGRIWVGRSTRAGEPSLFDIFDGEGRPIAQVSLDPNSSIVGFGADGALYTTRTDEVGLQWLQRRRVR